MHAYRYTYIHAYTHPSLYSHFWIQNMYICIYICIYIYIYAMNVWIYTCASIGGFSAYIHYIWTKIDMYLRSFYSQIIFRKAVPTALARRSSSMWSMKERQKNVQNAQTDWLGTNRLVLFPHDLKSNPQNIFYRCVSGFPSYVTIIDMDQYMGCLILSR